MARNELRGALHCVELLCSCGEVNASGEASALHAQWERRKSSVCSPANVAAMCKCLKCAHADVRLAAASVFHIVGRAQNAFTKESLAEGLLAASLFGALQDAHVDVRRTACSAVGNFMNHRPSPARQALYALVCPARAPQHLPPAGGGFSLVQCLSTLAVAGRSSPATYASRVQGVVRKLAELASAELSAEGGVPVSAVQALRNSICESTSEIRQEFIDTMPWPRMKMLLDSSDVVTCLLYTSPSPRD